MSNPIKFISEEEVEKIDPQLYRDIENYVDENITNWTEQCSCEEEGDALDFFIGRRCATWRVRNDGTIDVIIEDESKESFDFEWEDEDGDERTSNALDLLMGYVSHEFDDDCNNDIVWNSSLEERIIGLFNK